MPESYRVQELLQRLTLPSPKDRHPGAIGLFVLGLESISRFLDETSNHSEFQSLIVFHKSTGTVPPNTQPKITVGIAVQPETFATIHAANGSPALAAVPPDQDAEEFELFFPSNIQLDILTTKTPGGGGAIDRFLGRFGEAVQQVELDVTDIDRATEILRGAFQLEPIYPATRPGANGTRVNFFLAPDSKGKKVLVELVEQAKHTH